MVIVSQVVQEVMLTCLCVYTHHQTRELEIVVFEVRSHDVQEPTVLVLVSGHVGFDPSPVQRLLPF